MRKLLWLPVLVGLLSAWTPVVYAEPPHYEVVVTKTAQDALLRYWQTEFSWVELLSAHRQLLREGTTVLAGVTITTKDYCSSNRPCVRVSKDAVRSVPIWELGGQVMFGMLQAGFYTGSGFGYIRHPDGRIEPDHGPNYVQEWIESCLSNGEVTIVWHTVSKGTVTVKCQP